MNFAGPFDSELSHDSPVSLGGERFAFDSKPGFVQHRASDSHVVIPDAHLLFSGDYTRIGSDLIISANGQKFVVGNYFKGETRPALTTKDGATLSGHIVDALTGHVHYAQATATPAASEVIGHVQKLSGSASVIRNGVAVELQVGAAVQKGDVIQTGSNSTLGMTFIDGSAFGMTSNARMVLNEMIFDPNGSSNSSLMSLVQGTITFVAGQTAKNGNMRVETPVATMGIRGTAVLVEIGANDGPTKFSVLVEPDGHTGAFNLYDKVTGQLIGTVSQAGQVTFVSSLGIGQPPTAIEQLKTLADQQAEKAIIQQVFQLYFPNYNPDDSNPKMPKFGSNTSGNNLAEILFTTNSNNRQTFLTQIELRFAVTDPVTGITTYQNKIFYNTKAQFSALAVSADQAFVSTTETFKFMDVVQIDDPDIGNAPFYDIGVPFVAGSAIITSAVSTTTAPTEAALKNLLTINQTTGEVTFDRHDFNFLDDGEKVEYVIRVTATSGPDTGNVEIHVTINGANDAPVFGTPIAVDLHEIGAPDVVPPPTGGTGVLQEAITLHFTDADLSETGGNYSVTVSEVHTTGSTAGFDPGTLETTLRDFFSFATTPVTKDVDHTDGYIHGIFSANDRAFDYLAEGQQLVIIYTVELTEIDYSSVHFYQQFMVTITGSNDVPVIAIADVAQTDTIYEIPGQTGGTGFDHNANGDTPSGSIHFSDVDLIDRPEPSTTSQIITYLSADGLDDLTASLTPAQRSAIETAFKISVPTGSGANTNNGVVDWTYKLVDSALDFLAQGETIKLVSTVRISDGNGGFADATVTINIVGGANDTPSISSVSDLVLTELATPLHDAITVDFIDVDLTETGHTASVQDVAMTGVVPPGTIAGQIFTSGAFFDLLTAGAVIKNSGDSSGTASFDFNAGPEVFDYLATDEVITLTYTVAVIDSFGAAGTHTVTVTITGTNDAPTVSAALTLATSEGDAPVVRDLLEGASDVDASDTLSVTNIQYSVDDGPLTATAPDGITILPDGHTINVDGANPAFDHLAAGATQEIVVSYDVTDTHGATVAQTETITITGLNDRPVLAAGEDLTTITEDQTANSGQSVGSFATGISDADDGALKGVAIIGYTSPDGHWEYSIDGGGIWTAFETYSSASGLLLASDDKVRFVPNGVNGGTETLTYVAWDQTSGTHGETANTALAEHWAAFSQDSQTASLTVTDVNDAAVIGDPPMADVRGGFTDTAGNLVASGMLSISDVDSPATFSTTVADAAGHVNFGTLSLETDGQYVYSVENLSVEALTGVQTHVDVFTIQSQDGTSKDISFTINGVTEIASTGANETLVATAGRDNFVFNSAFGDDTITGFTLGADAMVFDHSLFATVADILAAATSSGSDTIITHGTDTVTLTGISLAQVQAHQSDFHIV